MMDSFWDLLWYTLLVFAFVAYLMILFQILGDLFRDRKMSGIVKTLWIIFLIVLPYLTAFVYLIARGPGMAERHLEAQAAARQATDHYIREVAGKSAAEHIADAKALLDSGTITQAEFDVLKAKALS
ncbi:SHOCT domain-containing protein [Rhodococcus sp. IEGM 248]|uniref:SHOCT domain-containing protein n=1 Tax=Rhodococcus opacus TaxID=37919 RepID=UPI0013C15B05|nr:SHOCT domain-containing protein [Rhodococcus opacus]MDV7090029.1 SHOCT domain-containing protein [Rhodococcus opacus]NDV08894.1 SHOCT domain-containing protein [Rhodococcus sp. IEGM 248]